MEKHSITVRVAGKDYRLVSSDDEAYIRQVAANVSRQVNELKLASGLPIADVAVLTSLNMADELMKSREEANRLRKELDDTRQVLEEMKAVLH